MPLLILHVIEGRSQQEIDALLDAIHRLVLDTFHVPQRDHYQIVHEYKPGHVRFEDTGLSIARTNKFVLLQVITRPRPTEQKTSFYKSLCDELQRSCNIQPSEVMISIVSNTDDDWSFGLGRARFLTGELGGSKAGSGVPSGRSKQPAGSPAEQRRNLTPVVRQADARGDQSPRADVSPGNLARVVWVEISLEEALEQTFPASDPISMQQAVIVGGQNTLAAWEKGPESIDYRCR